MLVGAGANDRDGKIPDLCLHDMVSAGRLLM